jgi:hypothetical protein
MVVVGGVNIGAESGSSGGGGVCVCVWGGGGPNHDPGHRRLRSFFWWRMSLRVGSVEVHCFTPKDDRRSDLSRAPLTPPPHTHHTSGWSVVEQQRSSCMERSGANVRPCVKDDHTRESAQNPDHAAHRHMVANKATATVYWQQGANKGRDN